MIASWDYLSIRVLPLFFAIALGFFFYFLKTDKPDSALWSGFVVYVIVGLFFVALIHEKVFSETETSGLLRPAS